MFVRSNDTKDVISLRLEIEYCSIDKVMNLLQMFENRSFVIDLKLAMMIFELNKYLDVVVFVNYFHVIKQETMQN